MLMWFALACLVVTWAGAAQLPQACIGSNNTVLSGCVPLRNESLVSGLTVHEGQYRHFHWVVTNYLDIDDANGERKSITFEVTPCRGNAEVYVRALQLPWPTITSYDYAATAAGEPNAVTVQMLRASYYVSVYGAASGDTVFSIIAKISGGRKYPAAGAGGATSVTNRFTESLLLPDDPMDMEVSFVPVPGESGYEYRVFSTLNTTDSPCDAGKTTGCIMTTGCGVEAAMTPRSPWTALQYDGTNATIVASGLAQNQEQVFVVVGRPVGANLTESADVAVVYTATTGTPQYEKETQLQDDNTILMTLGIVAGVLVFLFGAAFTARACLIRAYQSRARKRREGNLDAALIRRQVQERQQEKEAASSGASTKGEASGTRLEDMDDDDDDDDHPVSADSKPRAM